MAAAAVAIAAPAPADTLTLTLGPRYDYSAGRFGETLYAVGESGRQTLARIRYRPQAGHAAGLTFRIDDSDTDWFARGSLSGGVLSGGTQTDASAPPVVSPASRTRSTLHGGDQVEAGLDIGRTLWRRDGARIGAYVGYGFRHETARAFGRVQTGAYPAYLPGEIPSYQPTFTQTNDWHAAQAGASGRLPLIGALDLTVDATFIYAYLDGRDQHIESGLVLPMHGSGAGGRLEAGLEYPLSDTIALAIGGRYWAARADARISAGRSADIDSRRYGLFVRLTTAFERTWTAHQGAAGVAPDDEATPPATGPAVWELGTRYWHSAGDFGYTLFSGSDPSQRVSRLRYGGQNGNGAEGFFRVEADDGWFAKGLLGGGFLAGGHLIDEDFATPDFSPYSRTRSNLHGGKLAYVGLDVGHEIWRGPATRLGAFAGYQFHRETADAFGCTQTATSTLCAPGDIDGSTASLAQTDNWHLVRAGLNGRTPVIGALYLDVDAALVYGILRGEDRHVLRTDINPLPLHGSGLGGQVEAVLRYPLTDILDLGIGGRYWTLRSSGHSLWGKTPAYRDDGNSKTDVWSRRYGVFLQLTATLDARDAPTDD